MGRTEPLTGTKQNPLQSPGLGNHFSTGPAAPGPAGLVDERLQVRALGRGARQLGERLQRGEQVRGRQHRLADHARAHQVHRKLQRGRARAPRAQHLGRNTSQGLQVPFRAGKPTSIF